ncbi:MAG: ionic transporter y4hA [Ideonella sp. MAG2]|nr:MAG: ionic transporter y4hA [Ideonella sp. MAG2]
MLPFIAYPLLSALVFASGLLWPHHALFVWLAAPSLVLAVVSSVHHAEVIAHKVGEPYGTLVLALAVTVIEVALVLSMMLAGGANAATVPRDTIYAAVMIICNGVVGVCLLAGGLRHKEQLFRIEGTGSGLAALVVMSTLVLVLPSLTTSAPGANYTASQLIFVAAGSLVLWLVFVFIQTVRHRDYFLPAQDAADEDVHATPPTTGQALASFALLIVALVSVVGLAKLLSPTLESLVRQWQAPAAVVGTLIAIIVLAPETWAAIRAARANRLQTSMNLAVGSALASIGLTIPVVVLASVWLNLPLTLGLVPKDMALLVLTFLVGAITLASGRTNLMQGAIHLVVFAAFLFLTFVP